MLLSPRVIILAVALVGLIGVYGHRATAWSASSAEAAVRDSIVAPNYPAGVPQVPSAQPYVVSSIHCGQVDGPTGAMTLLYGVLNEANLFRTQGTVVYQCDGMTSSGEPHRWCVSFSTVNGTRVEGVQATNRCRVNLSAGGTTTQLQP
jgi:hypothetical protein